MIGFHPISLSSNLSSHTIISYIYVIGVVAAQELPNLLARVRFLNDMPVGSGVIGNILDLHSSVMGSTPISSTIIFYLTNECSFSRVVITVVLHTTEQGSIP